MSRRRVGEPVLLNVYDLHPANEHLRFLGLGAYHSGVEVFGSEYTFANGGVFSTTPKDANGAPLCETIVLGETFEGSRDVERMVDELRRDFPAGTYHLLKKNCNSFSEALARKLLNRSIPGWVNRSATLGQYCSCFMPEDGAGQAPVQDGSAGSEPSGGSGFHVIRGRGAAAKKPPPRREVMSFAGGGSSSFSDPDAGSSGPRARAAPAGTGRRLGSLAASSASSDDAATSRDAPGGSWWGGGGSGAPGAPAPAAAAGASSGGPASVPASERRELMLRAALRRQGQS
ncbi:hypothetical protein FNF31_07881 [Cafeteria roenbergensis]|nr:hypothetical protein FNF31_07881 [Cafeteria roenbergensis]CAE7327955.1 unnamed protein product [Symbiodinium sp. KB8]